jgi:hypothetical protein
MSHIDIQGFWTIVNFLTDGLLLSAFALRVAGLRIEHQNNPKDAAHLQLKSFQVLSCVAPLIWMKLVSPTEYGDYVG